MPKKTLVFKRNYNRKKKLKSRSETENDIVIDKNVYDDILMFRLSTFKKSSARARVCVQWVTETALESLEYSLRQSKVRLYKVVPSATPPPCERQLACHCGVSVGVPGTR